VGMLDWIYLNLWCTWIFVMLQHTLQHNVVAVCVKVGMLDWIYLNLWCTWIFVLLQHTLQHNVVAVCVTVGMLDWICNPQCIANSIEHPHFDTHCNNIVLQCVLQHCVADCVATLCCSVCCNVTNIQVHCELQIHVHSHGFKKLSTFKWSYRFVQMNSKSKYIQMKLKNCSIEFKFPSTFKWIYRNVQMNSETQVNSNEFTEVNLRVNSFANSSTSQIQVNSIEHLHFHTHCNNIVLQCVLQHHEYSSTSQLQVNSIEHLHFHTHCNNIVLQCVLQHHERSSTSQIQVNPIAYWSIFLFQVSHPHFNWTSSTFQFNLECA